MKILQGSRSIPSGCKFRWQMAWGLDGRSRNFALIGLMVSGHDANARTRPGDQTSFGEPGSARSHPLKNKPTRPGHGLLGTILPSALRS